MLGYLRSLIGRSGGFFALPLLPTTVPRYELVNVVGGGNLGVEIDLFSATPDLEDYNPSYEPEQSPGIHFELPSTAVTAMVFRTGEYHLTGAKSVDQIQEAGKELERIIETELGIHLKPTEPDIRNLVYSGNIGMEVRLEALVSELKGNVLYEPSMHAGLQYRKDEWDGLIILFRTGSYTYTGSSSPETSEESLESFHQEMEELLG